MFFLVPGINLKLFEISYVTESMAGWRPESFSFSKQSSPEDRAMTSKETTGARDCVQ